MSSSPNGWHVALHEELMALSETFGATELKAVDGWYEDENGNNASGFDANPNGSRNGDNGHIQDAGAGDSTRNHEQHRIDADRRPRVWKHQQVDLALAFVV